MGVYDSAGESSQEYTAILNKIYADKFTLASETEKKIYEIQLDNLERLYKLTLNREVKLQREKIDIQQKTNEELIKLGISTQTILDLRKEESSKAELEQIKATRRAYGESIKDKQDSIKQLNAAYAGMTDEEKAAADELIAQLEQEKAALIKVKKEQDDLLKKKQAEIKAAEDVNKAEEKRIELIKKQGTEKEKQEVKEQERNKKRAKKLMDRSDAAAKSRSDLNKIYEGTEEFEGVFKKGATMEERVNSFTKATTNPETGNFDVGRLITGLSNLTQLLNGKIEDIALLKGDFETQLQGATINTTAGGVSGAVSTLANLLTGGLTLFGGHHQQIMSMAARASIVPYIKEDTLVKNIQALVDKGIAFDVTQRAFLNTIKDKIAVTFDAANGTLLKLIRIQQTDSTAARLGLESSLTAFLNNMYTTSEYMHEAAASVKDSLYEVEALMSAEGAIGLEGTVHKWLGSLYSVGVGQNSINNISNALGKILSGQIEGVTQGGAGNLIIMAANRANLSISDMLAKGLDDSDTNKLLRAAVEYLQDIYSQSADNRVVAQQISNVFGVSASDLKAVANLMSEDRGLMQSITNQVFDYQTSMDRVNFMANTMFLRTGLGEMMTNAWDNLQYTMASGIASNPVLYGIYKVGNLMKDTGANINLPFVNVMGFGVDLNTTVADLMIAGSLVGSVLSGIGNLIGGLTQGLTGGYLGMGGVNAWGMNTLGIKNLSASTVSRRGGSGGSGNSVSESGYVGNSSGGDVENATLAQADNDKESTMAEAKENHTGVMLDDVYDEVVLIYELLNDVRDGKDVLWVKVKDYGLTGWTK